MEIQSLDKETEKDFLDNMTYLWGGVTRAKEKNTEALAWVNKQIAKAYQAGREEALKEVKRHIYSINQENSGREFRAKLDIWLETFIKSLTKTQDKE